MVKYSILRVLLKTVGRLSQGINLCLTEGATSGKVLDYIYANTPAGKFLIGKWLDKLFLSYPSCQSVRLRRQHIEALIEESIEALKDKKTFILDVASGQASYLLAVLEKNRALSINALCEDIDERWLKEGEARAAEQRLENIRFAKGDGLVFKERETPPNILISSGFIDWIEEDELAQRSLKNAYDTLAPGGYFILANQEGHPNLSLVQNVFEGFEHRPLRLKTRPEGVIRGWLNDVGFQIEKVLKDKNSHYAVFKAYK